MSAYTAAELSAAESLEADRLAATAANAGRGAISRTLATAAVLAVESVQDDRGRGEIGEPAADLRELRTDPRLTQARDHDLRAAASQALTLLLGAITAGYRMDGENRGAAQGLPVRFTLTPQDHLDLADYPIHGRSARELAQRLRGMLADAIDEATARPLDGAIEPASLPMMLGEVARLHGVRLGQAVAEAYYAGCQAATRALGKALTRGR